MGDIKGGKVITGAGAEAEALTGIMVAMRNAPMVVVATVDGMMIGIIIMIVGVEGVEAQVLAIGEDGAEALGERGIVAQSVKAVRRDVLKLSNGTVKGNNWKIQTKLIMMLPVIAMRMVTMDMSRTMISTLGSSRSNLHRRLAIDLIKSLCGCHSLVPERPA